MTKEIILDHDGLISGLFCYIRKNKNIPDFFHQIESDRQQHQNNLDALSKAINLGDYNATILLDRNVSLYLLFLIKEKLIPFDQGMTFYEYYLILAQFTDKQNVKPGDVKSLSEVTTLKLLEDNQITPIGKEYIKKTIVNFNKKIYKNLDFNEVVDFLLTLPISETYLFKINIIKWDTNTDVEVLMGVLEQNMPFCMTKTNQESYPKREVFLPSISMINFFIQSICGKPIQMKPMLGIVSEKTLSTLHEQNQHPISLYSPFIKSNLRHVDHYFCGPLVTWLHDIGHCFWGSLLSFNERETIYSTFIPFMYQLREEASKVNDKDTIYLIDKIIGKAYDLNLTPISQLGKTHKLDTFLAQCFGNNGNSLGLYASGFKEFSDIGACAEDRLLFLIAKLYYESTDRKSENEEFYDRVLSASIRSSGNFHRPLSKIVTIEKVALACAKSSAPDSRNRFFITDTSNLNFKLWNALLTNTKDSKEIWNTASTDSKYQLERIIKNYNLKFFEPYIPLSDSEYNRLYRIVEAGCIENTLHTPSRSIPRYYRNYDSDLPLKKS